MWLEQVCTGTRSQGAARLELSRQAHDLHTPFAFSSLAHTRQKTWDGFSSDDVGQDSHTNGAGIEVGVISSLPFMPVGECCKVIASEQQKGFLFLCHLILPWLTQLQTLAPP